jgi:hypothetical protein
MIEVTIDRMAAERSASASTTLGDLPQSSRVTGITFCRGPARDRLFDLDRSRERDVVNRRMRSKCSAPASSRKHRPEWWELRDDPNVA